MFASAIKKVTEENIKKADPRVVEIWGNNKTQAADWNKKNVPVKLVVTGIYALLHIDPVTPTTMITVIEKSNNHRTDFESMGDAIKHASMINGGC